MKKKFRFKGFTLIELLAVIVILGIIMVIAVPKVLNAADEGNKKAFMINGENLVSIVSKKYIKDGLTGEKHYTIANGAFVGDSLDLTGEMPKNGLIFIDEEGKVALSISNEKYCVKKNLFTDRVTINNDILDCELDLFTPSYCFETADISATEIEITGYDSNCPRDVVIPSSLNGKTVTRIGDFAFGYHVNVVWYKDEEKKVAYNDNDSYGYQTENKLALSNGGGSTDFIPIESVTIPNTVTNIGESAFENCLLSEVIIPEGVLSIGFAAFKDNRLTSITIPDSVTTMGGSVFFGNQIKNFDLGEGLTEIPSLAFAFNPLEKVVIPDNIINVSEEAFYYGGINYSELDIGKGLTSIDFLTSNNKYYLRTLKINMVIIPSYVFNNTNVESIIIGNDVVEIGSNAFFQSTRLNSLVLGSNVEIIGQSAFSSCNDLENVILPGKLSVIEANAFSYSGLTSIVIPAGVTSIEASAFRYNQLASVIFPNTLEEIGFWAFQGNNLTSITIPNSVTSIGYYAFLENSLTSVTLPADISMIDGYVAQISNSFYTAYVVVNLSAAGTYTAPSQYEAWTKQ